MSLLLKRARLSGNYTDMLVFLKSNNKAKNELVMLFAIMLSFIFLFVLLKIDTYNFSHQNDTTY